jgi:hypothetical protein
MEQSTTAKETNMKLSDRNEILIDLNRDRIQMVLNHLKNDIAKMETYFGNAPTDPELVMLQSMANINTRIVELHTAIAINAGIIKGHDNQFKGLGA